MNQQPQPRLFKVKEGKLPQWLAWCEQLSTILQDEARATIRDEGATHEFCIVLEITGAHYVIGTMLTDTWLEPRPSNTSQVINQEHKRMRQECLEYVGKVEYGYFLKAAA